MLKQIFNLYKKRFIAYAFSDEESKALMVDYVFKNQRKPKKLHNFKLAFIDSKGVKYYQPESELEFGIRRLSVFMRYHAFLKASISYSELIKICDLQDNIWNDIRVKSNLQIIKRGEKTTDQLREMLDNPAHEELLFLVAATFYLREDEDPADKVDTDIEAEKIAEFKKYSQEELYDFFYKTPLKEHFDLYGITEKNLPEYLKLSRLQAGKFQMTIQHLTSQNAPDVSISKG